jgi:hypothetical protein
VCDFLQIDNAKYDRSQARGAGVLYSHRSRNLSSHETPANYGAERQAPDMLQVLPGISVVPHQCDDAEQHRRRAKDDPPARRPFHTQKVADISKSRRGARNKLYARSDTLTSRNSSAGSKVDSAQPGVLGDPYDGRVWTRGNCHSHESPGAALDAPDEAHAGTLWRNHLGSARDCSPEGAFQLV